MKYILIILMSIGVYSVSFASFPAKRSTERVEAVVETLDTDQVSANAVAYNVASGSSFSIGGFALGFLLGLIGVLIAYIGWGKSNVSRSSWYGLLASFVLYLLLIA